MLPPGKEQQPSQAPPSRGSSSRRWLLAALTVAAACLLLSHFTHLEALARTLARGDWRWVLLAIAVQGLYYLDYAGIYQAVFRAVGVVSRLRDLLPVLFAGFFVEFPAPYSSYLLWLDDAARRGQPTGRVAAGLVLVRLADFGAFALVLGGGLLYLFQERELKPYEILGAGGLLLVLITLAGCLVLGRRRGEWLRLVLDRIQGVIGRLAARLGRTSPLPQDWAARTAEDFSGASSTLTEHPRELFGAFGLSLLAHGLDLLALHLLFLAFHEPVGLGTLVAGYGIGVLFWIVAITPQGVGVVETVMALVFSSLGVPAERAVVIALGFRGLSLWLPVAIGFLTIQHVRSFQAVEKEP